MPDDPVLARLLAQFAGVERACVAFSGGADSSLVLAAAARALGHGNVVAVTATSPTYLDEELAAARALADGLGVEHVVVATHEFDDGRFVANSRERCYFCKAGLLDELVRVAAAHGGAALVDGANADDAGDHRPGMRAAAERGVLQPLLAAGIGKAEVRRLARELGLSTWDAPQQACLASRVPYGEAITPAKLAAVADAERALRALGFRQCRVRHHGDVARLEVERDELGRALELREQIARAVHAAGFTYVALDMDGFRTGSMNEA
ncbi:MAG TPA: ATP-dependent sacrificial sulfur transferase LarE [Thermoleophilia bacterium]|nr:ATP-dependent sacrificial sulfur transferase LarE [Thermoleophilia bacterium]